MENFILRSEDKEALRNWNFNILKVSNLQEKYRHTWAMFQALNYMEKYEIDLKRFSNFLFIVQEKYNHRKNPFHNFDHAFTVAHGAYTFIRTKKLNNYLLNIEQFSLLLSALLHDIDHTGRTNAFESASLSKLALKYNDDSVKLNIL